MRFALNKYTLTHFTRRRGFNLQAPVQLQGAEARPRPSVKILGLQLDPKLRWKAQEKAVQARMNTQMLALQRIATSIWGVTMLKARQVYQAVIRPALVYGAAVWHEPTPIRARNGNTQGKPRGLAAKLLKQQNQGLRIVLGAFKATPIRQLETESFIAPLDLWLNGRVARFQARLESSGIAQRIRDACGTIRARILSRRNSQNRQNRQRATSIEPASTPGTVRKAWPESWTGTTTEAWDLQEKQLVLRDWEKRWHAENKKLGCSVRPNEDPGKRRVVPEDTLPTKQILGLHKEL